MMWRACFLSMLLATIPVAAAAQDKPDFSGRWALVSASHTSPDVATSLLVHAGPDLATVGTPNRASLRVRGNRHFDGMLTEIVV